MVMTVSQGSGATRDAARKSPPQKAKARRTEMRTEERRAKRNSRGAANSMALEIDSATPPTLLPRPCSMQKYGRYTT